MNHISGAKGILNCHYSLVIPAAIPQTVQTPEVLLVVMIAWGGFAGSLYNISLAMLADRFKGTELAAANAAFGTLYALGNLFGPLLHGMAMDWANPQGLMVSAALLFALFLGGALRPARRAQ
ncbi:MFS transporter [Magnetospirillum sp. 15-1]|uniref:MFS transporter n=1 Tax=Magnetospirillum sp. 15-1 TaxID=1979370 RepID=UPI001142F430|nr:MFS transporter [Magnetospirillum sp. 15-1]